MRRHIQPTCMCHGEHATYAAEADSRSASFFEFDPMEDYSMIKNPVILSTAHDLLNLLARLRASAPGKTLKAHYQGLYMELKNAMNTK